MAEPERQSKRWHLVAYEYGMGAVQWWWVWAWSAQEIVETCAEVGVVTDRELLSRATEWELEELALDSELPEPLASLRAERDQQRARPGFGKLVGKQRVYLRGGYPDTESDDGMLFLVECGADGRRLRQVERFVDGTRIRTESGDWLFEPPLDLLDPFFADMEISQAEFEAEWRRASRDGGNR